MQTMSTIMMTEGTKAYSIKIMVMVADSIKIKVIEIDLIKIQVIKNFALMWIF